MADHGSPLGKIELAATSFYVADVDAAVSWYEDKLGLRPAMVGTDGHRYASFLMGSALVVLEPREAALEPADPGPETTTVNLIVDRDPTQVREDLVEPRGAVRRARQFAQLPFVSRPGPRREPLLHHATPRKGRIRQRSLRGRADDSSHSGQAATVEFPAFGFRPWDYGAGHVRGQRSLRTNCRLVSGRVSKQWDPTSGTIPHRVPSGMSGPWSNT